VRVRRSLSAFTSSAPRAPGAGFLADRLCRDAPLPRDLDALVADAAAALGLRELIDATVAIVADRAGDAAHATLRELAARAIEERRGRPEHFPALFAALARCVFNAAYVAGASVLGDFVRESTAFRERCQCIAGERCAAIGIDVRVLPAPAAAIADVFRAPRMPTRVALAFYTNPIDIASAIADAVDAFAKRVVRVEIDRERAAALIAGAIVVDPPVNVVAVAECLRVWRSLVMSERDAFAVDAFLLAMKVIDPDVE
jgi:hypothetical protein